LCACMSSKAVCCRVAPQGPKQPIGLPRLALEQHMSAYKAECDVQLEVQVAARVERVKEWRWRQHARRQQQGGCGGFASMGSSGCCGEGGGECDVQLEVQVAARVERIKEVELAAARQEAAARWVWCIAGMGCSGCCRGLLGLIGDWGHIPCQCCQGHSRPNTWLPGKAH
jgi:hypothetical protein